MVERSGNAEHELDDLKLIASKWLALIDRSDAINAPIPYYVDGRQLKGAEFLLVCKKEDVEPYFNNLEGLNPDDPKRPEYVEALQAVVDHFINNTQSEQS